MSLISTALLPLRIARRVAEAVKNAVVAAAPSPPDLVLIEGMPEGVSPAALQREPACRCPPRGTYIYPDGPAARNGADIFRVAIGLSATDTWWRIDWNSLFDKMIPVGLFIFDTDRGTSASNERPANSGVRSAGTARTSWV